MTADNPAFQSKVMDREALGKWILRRLGAPIWKVELTQDHLDDAIESAKRWFAAKKGLFRLAEFRTINNRPDYPLPDDCDFIIDLAFEQSAQDISTIWSPFLLMEEEIPYDVFAAPQSIGLYSSYVQSIQYIEQAKRITGSELDWFQRDRHVYISPTPSTNRRIIYLYKTSIFAINQLSERDHELIKRYALAKAKQDLGRVRSKWDFNAAQGTAPIDGDRLLDEARDEIEKLEEDIILAGYPMHFLVG